MEKIESLKLFDSAEYANEIEAKYISLKAEIEVKIIYLIWNILVLRGNEDNINNFVENLGTYRDRNKVYKDLMQKKIRSVDYKFISEIIAPTRRENKLIFANRLAYKAVSLNPQNDLNSFKDYNASRTLASIKLSSNSTNSKK